MAGPDGLSEKDGAGTATGTLACSKSPILTGAHDGLSVRIESVKEFFCLDIPGGGREIVSRKRKITKMGDSREEKEATIPRSLSHRERAISEIF